MARLSPTFLLMSLLAAACGGSDAASPPRSPPPSGSGDTVTGRERFGWTQPASDSDAGLLQFAAYVDGVPARARRRLLHRGRRRQPRLFGAAAVDDRRPSHARAGRVLPLGRHHRRRTEVRGAPTHHRGRHRGQRRVSSCEPRGPATGERSVAASDGSELVAEVLGTEICSTRSTWQSTPPAAASWPSAPEAFASSIRMDRPPMAIAPTICRRRATRMRPCSPSRSRRTSPNRISSTC